MRIIKSICIATIMAMAFPSCSGGDAATVTEGVSKELADLRSSTLSDIRYDLSFDIPAERDSLVSGCVTVSFESTSKTLPQLDFKAPDASFVSEVSLDGTKAAFEYSHEHIILSQAGSPGAGHHDVTVRFTAPDQSLNRRDDMLYSLLVPDRARTLFPCFDQPDLKASYTLSLCVPEGWTAVSNSPLTECSDTLRFAPTEPLSTYLFSFTAGRYFKETRTRGDREISMYHRETDPFKLAQVDMIFDEVFGAMEWMEDYTGIPYPFRKYDFVVIPGFQFGGMEHTGNTFYADTRMFLDRGDGLVREQGRYNLIAHEVSHMWFGDLVTMKWFDDVWTKEVFANWFAARMQKERFPESDLSMALADYAVGAYAVDRTPGANPVKQKLGNLKDAGLMYGNIIYDKSPIVMEMIAQIMSPEQLQASLREYLHTFAFGNSDWNDLVAILDAHTSFDMRAFSKAWIEEPGMPEISVSEEGVMSQTDPLGRGLVWSQDLTCALVRPDGSRDTVELFLNEPSLAVPEYSDSTLVLPNIDARGYGFFRLGEREVDWCLERLSSAAGCAALSAVEKSAILLNLFENALRGGLDKARFGAFLLDYLNVETDQNLVGQASSCLSRMQFECSLSGGSGLDGFDGKLMDLVQGNAPEPVRRRAFALRVRSTRSDCPDILDAFLSPESFKAFSLTESELTTMALELAVRNPERADEIISVQKGRITNKDRQDRFSFISKSVSSSEQVLDSTFNSLLDARNRRIEPWASTALSYLDHPLRNERSLKYILPGLEVLEDVQRTGDIFFPTAWLSALLGGHGDGESGPVVDSFLADHPDYPPLLRAKILQQRD